MAGNRRFGRAPTSVINRIEIKDALFRHDGRFLSWCMDEERLEVATA